MSPSPFSMKYETHPYYARLPSERKREMGVIRVCLALGACALKF
jgi:hypothetical protein